MLANADRFGFYRVNYPPELRTQIARQIAQNGIRARNGTTKLALLVLHRHIHDCCWLSRVRRLCRRRLHARSTADDGIQARYTAARFRYILESNRTERDGKLGSSKIFYFVYVSLWFVVGMLDDLNAFSGAGYANTTIAECP